ncbi:MAG: tyrosine-type recombinase/integrase [Gemmataceae bacterium]
MVERATGCRDEQAARQVLARWEREVERIRAGTLDPAELDAARRAATPLVDHLAAYEQSLVAGDTSATYRANLRRAVVRVAADCGFATLADVRRGPVEGWLAARAAEGMGGRTRNYYRESLIAFANWCRETGRLKSHDLHRLPKADGKADPRRPRRALTEEELTRLLAVAAARPLRDARTIRRGKRKGEVSAVLTPARTARLEAIGRERALIYKTLVLTGLRADELRTLTVGQLDLTAGAASLQLDAADEKSREGNALPVRDDLAADLRAWLADQLAALQATARNSGEHIPTRLPGDAPVFKVPTSLRVVMDRDLKAAGIPKRDDRGRTVDVHALRTTFCTLLSKGGVAPRTAQAAMRHSDIKLTMGAYTDPRLLDVRGAVANLPALSLSPSPRPTHPATGTPSEPNSVAPPVAPTPYNPGHSGPSAGRAAPSGELDREVGSIDVTSCPVNEKAPVTPAGITGASVGLTGFEPATSWSRSTRAGGRITEKPAIPAVMGRTPPTF